MPLTIGRKKKAILECECCGVCPGCCMPVDIDGNPTDIPFEISAPGCAIDGTTGVFTPLAIEGTSAPCGICGSWGYSATLDIPGSFWNPDGLGGCDLLPGCTVTFCLNLLCSAEAGVTDDPGNAECCRRMRLYYASTYEFTGSTDNGGTGQCGAGFNYERYIGPDSCSCVGALSAIFSIDVDPIVKNNPDCGMVQDCVPDCDATGIQVII